MPVTVNIVGWVDQEAEWVFERSRRAIAWLTAAMTLLSVVFALIGLHIGSTYVDRQSAMALVADVSQMTGGRGQQTMVEPRTGPGPTVVAPTTTTSERTAALLGPTAVEPGTTSVSEPPTSTTTTTPSSPAPTITTAPTPAAPTITTAPAPAPTVDPADRGRAALGRIGYPWSERLPGWTIEFLDGRKGLYGLTVVDEKRIEIYVRVDQTDDLLDHIVAHELGHAVDVTLNDGDDRRRWQAARGIEDEPWWPNAAASDFHTGAGDFAESFAYWQTRSSNYRSRLGPAPSGTQLQIMAELSAG